VSALQVLGTHDVHGVGSRTGVDARAYTSKSGVGRFESGFGWDADGFEPAADERETWGTRYVGSDPLATRRPLLLARIECGGG